MYRLTHDLGIKSVGLNNLHTLLNTSEHYKIICNPQQKDLQGCHNELGPLASRTRPFRNNSSAVRGGGRWVGVATTTGRDSGSCVGTSSGTSSYPSGTSSYPSGSALSSASAGWGLSTTEEGSSDGVATGSSWEQRKGMKLKFRPWKTYWLLLI